MPGSTAVNLIKTMSLTQYLFCPPAPMTAPIRGMAPRFPINRLFFVGRNYHAHAVEMGRPVDKSVERPFYFTKSPQTLTASGATVAYPPETSNYHFEMELVVAIGKAGFRVKAEDAHTLIYGYAAGLDMTRRDLQLVARDKGRPWDLGKDVEQSSVCSEIVPMEGVMIESGAIALEVNGQTQQSSNVDKLIWNIRELIADLSLFYHLQPGDLIYTGTPEGVGPVVPGDKITGRVEGVAEVALTVGAPE
jgi:fumarylpyruvate hydrolase